METQIESYPINQELTFYQASENSLTVEAIALILTKKEQAIQRCCLIVAVTHQVYQFILENSLFNLKSEAVLYFKPLEFIADIAISLEIELRPDLLPELAVKANNTEDIVNYLVNLGLPLNLAQAHNATENWYCLSFKQDQETGQVGYRTFWDYINLSQINEFFSTGNQIIASFSSLIKEATASLAANLETANSSSENAVENMINFRQILQELDSSYEPQPQSISEAMREFFDQEDWNFVELEDDSILQMAYQGEHGRWNCFACAFEAAEQFVFYSVYPLIISSEKLLGMAEYLTKVNYGLIIGNFELDFSDGEIRYKTSIDVENDRLSDKNIKNLVYANVATMDKYLPGITATINTDISPDEALALVEDSLDKHQ